MIAESIEIKNVSISQLKPAEYNPRKSTEGEFAKLKDSILRFGIVDPLIVNGNASRMNVVIGGHFRMRVAKSIGYTEIPVVYVNIADIEREKELNLRLNRNLGEWDFTMLANFDESMLADIGFDSKELDRIFNQNVGEDDFDAEAEAEKIAEPQSKLGEVYELGNHRLMCGDSTNIEDVKRLMGEDRADMVFTDPSPYGVSIGAKNRMLNSFRKTGGNLKDIKDDSLSPDDLYQVLGKAFTNLKTVLADCCSIFTCSAQGGDLSMMMLMMMKDSGLEAHHVLIWKKNSPTFSMGRLDYDYQHEPILLSWNKSHKFYGGGKYKTSVWEIDKPRSSKEHPTMKPIELVENALLNNSERGNIVADIFGGSGTTLIACEKTNRNARLMEIDPIYCDVIKKRYEVFTGNKS